MLGNAQTTKLSACQVHTHRQKDIRGDKRDGIILVGSGNQHGRVGGHARQLLVRNQIGGCGVVNGRRDDQRRALHLLDRVHIVCENDAC